MPESIGTRIDELLAQVGSHRRAKNYDGLDDASDKLGKLTSVLKGMIAYEHMRAWVQIAEGQVGQDKAASLQAAITFSLESRDSAENGGDRIGALFADMVRSDIEESIDTLRVALFEAERLAHDVSDDESARLQRLIMNLQLHLINRTIDAGVATVDEVNGWVASLSANQIYLQVTSEGRKEVEMQKVEAFLAVAQH